MSSPIVCLTQEFLEACHDDAVHITSIETSLENLATSLKYGSIHLERIEGNYFTIRINQGYRIAIIKHDNHWICYDVMLNHSYSRGKKTHQARAEHILTRYLPELSRWQFSVSDKLKEWRPKTIDDSSPELTSDSASSTSVEIEPSLKKAPISSPTQLEFFGQKLLAPTELQYELMHLPLPAAISGVAGSGKTYVAFGAIARLAEKALASTLPDNTLPTVMYLAKSPELVESIRSEWGKSCYGNYTNVQFITVAEFLKSVYKDKRPIAGELREDFLNSQRKKQCQLDKTKSSLSPWLKYNNRQLLDEFRILSQYHSRNEIKSYLCLGETKSGIDKKDRASVFECFFDYQDTLDAKNLYDANYPFITEMALKYYAVILDEAQDVGYGLCKLLVENATQDNQVLFLSDNKQDLTQQLVPIESFFKQWLTKKAVHYLDKSYRCAKRIRDLTNNLLDIKSHTLKGHLDKDGQRYLSTHSQDEGTIRHFQSIEAFFRKHPWYVTHPSPDLIVIVGNQWQLRHYNEKYPGVMVATVEQAKGKEYKTVVAAFDGGIGDITAIAKSLAKMNSGAGAGRALRSTGVKRHQHKNKDRELHGAFFGAAFTMVTRAKSNAVICLKTIGQHPDVQESFHEQLFQDIPISTEELLDGDISDDIRLNHWQKRYTEAMRANNHTMALMILERHLDNHLPDGADDVRTVDTEANDTDSEIGVEESKVMDATVSDSTDKDDTLLTPPPKEIKSSDITKDNDATSISKSLLKSLKQIASQYHITLPIVSRSKKRGRNKKKAASHATHTALNTIQDKTAYLVQKLNHTKIDGDYLIHHLIKNPSKESNYQLRLMIEAGVDILIEDKEGHGTAHLAAKMGNAELIQILADNGFNLNAFDSQGITPALYAIEISALNVIKALAKARVDFNLKNNFGLNAAHFAARQKSMDIIKVLDDAGVDFLVESPVLKSNMRYYISICTPELLDKFNKRYSSYSDNDVILVSPAIIADLANNQPLLDFICEFQERPVSTDIPEFLTALSKIASRFNIVLPTDSRLRTSKEKVDYLVKAVNTKTLKGFYLINVLSEKGMLAEIKVLIKAGVDVNVATSEGCTAIYLAATNNQLAVIKTLHAAGANLDIPCSNGSTSIHIATQKNNIEAVNMLAALGANLQSTLSDGTTAMHLAAELGLTSIIDLLAEFGASVNVASKDGSTPAHTAAQFNQAKAIKALSERGADLNAKDYVQVHSPIHIAVFYDSAEATSALVTCKADVNATMQGNLTAAFIAAEHNHVKCLAELCAGGADLNLPQHSLHRPIDIAASKGHHTIIQTLAKAGANIQATPYGAPLHLAAKHGHAPAIIALIKAGAYIDEPLPDVANASITPLIAAITSIQIHAIRILAKLKANMNMRDPWGLTPAIFAVQIHNLSLIKTLVESGTDFNLSMRLAKVDIKDNLLASHKGISKRIDTFLSSREGDFLDILPIDIANILDYQDIVSYLSSLCPPKEIAHSSHLTHHGLFGSTGQRHLVTDMRSQSTLTCLPFH